jgi:oligopeptide transport system permease protein
MTAFALRRLAQLPLILAIVFLVTFTLAWIVPGNPLERPEGQRPSPEVQEAMRRQYNLDNPWRFMRDYLENLLLHGDFGPSLAQRGVSVGQIMAQALPVSAALGSLALLFGLGLGIAAGVIGAWRPGSILDLSSLLVALIGISIPTFVTAAILLVLFAGLLEWAPILAWEWPGWSIWTFSWWLACADMLAHMVLPAIALGLAPAAYIARLVRLGLADVMTSDFIRTAYAKGLPKRQVILKHALKVAMLPVISFLGPAAAATLTGSFVVEQVFGIPGLGQHFVRAVQNKDQFLILGLVLVYSTILIVFNLLVDLAYAWVDPRIEQT